MVPQFPPKTVRDQVSEIAAATSIFALNGDDLDHEVQLLPSYRSSMNTTTGRFLTGSFDKRLRVNCDDPSSLPRYSAALTPPAPGSFFFRKKLRKNIIAAKIARTMKVSIYAKVVAWACNN